jgi:predicted branched-subunit amino acid permease
VIPSRSFVAAIPPALAIVVFGVIYGSLARPQLGFGPTLLSSLFIFSGTVQFAVAALLTAGAGTGSLVIGALVLNLRNLLLGAVLRPRVEGGPLRRAVLAWFLTDESTGLALTGEGEAGRTLLVTGAMFYLAWQAGTILGSVGASFEGVVALARATFPVLFIGLAALACPTRAIALRAVAAAAVTSAIIVAAPDSSAVAAIGAAVIVSLPDRPA